MGRRDLIDQHINHITPPRCCFKCTAPLLQAAETILAKTVVHGHATPIPHRGTRLKTYSVTSVNEHLRCRDKKGTSGNRNHRLQVLGKGRAKRRFQALAWPR